MKGDRERKGLRGGLSPGGKGFGGLPPGKELAWAGFSIKRGSSYQFMQNNEEDKGSLSTTTVEPVNSSGECKG